MLVRAPGMERVEVHVVGAGAFEVPADGVWEELLHVMPQRTVRGSHFPAGHGVQGMAAGALMPVCMACMVTFSSPESVRVPWGVVASQTVTALFLLTCAFSTGLAWFICWACDIWRDTHRWRRVGGRCTLTLLVLRWGTSFWRRRTAGWVVLGGVVAAFVDCGCSWCFSLSHVEHRPLIAATVPRCVCEAWLDPAAAHSQHFNGITANCTMH